MASIHLQDIGKTYPNGQVAICSLNLTVADGELLVLVGPSGCGKSTTLRMVAGLETPTGGRIVLGGDDVTARPPQERDIAMVFQSYALYPHKNVRQNLAFGLEMRRVPRREIVRRIDWVARILGLEELLDRRPAELSGGQRQRVALGRAIVREPKAFLLDEPLSNLDAKLRVETRAELSRLHRRLRATMLYVTHDQEEAMTLGDRIAVMNQGRVEQVAAPMEVYRRPATAFVAGFVGSPSMSFLAGSLVRDGTGISVHGIGFKLSLSTRAVPDHEGREVLVGVRPQETVVVSPTEADITARVEVFEPLGGSALIHGVTGDGDAALRLTAVVPPECPVALDERIGFRFRRDRLHIFDAATGERLRV